ncbi:hypothetical protein RO21_12010, partial [[Actinobacillus] muris]
MKVIKGLFIILVLGVLGLLGLKRYLDCNPIHLGGTGTAIPAYCNAQVKVSETTMTKRDKLMYSERFERENQFSCRYEYKPPLSAETQVLYEYALYQDLHNMWTGKKNDEVWLNAAVYYRIAAANGDYKANIRLQYLLKTGRVSYSGQRLWSEDLVNDLNKQLAEQLLATAYYNLQGNVEQGYGVAGTDGTRWALLHRAAELGSREAQYVLGELIRGLNNDETEAFRRDLTKRLFQCASEQGEPSASLYLGIMYKREKNFTKALETFHQGAKNGSDSSARRLSVAFDGKREDDKQDIYFLNLSIDLERAKRYEMIGQYLSRNKHLQPKVPDLDEIVPLPPAELPAWDGKIAFQRWFEGESPEKPNEALVKKLAAQAGLDWETG